MTRALAIVVVLLLAVGCAARRTVGDVEVRSIQFDGNRGLLTDRSDANLRLTMSHERPRFRPWPIRRRVALDPVKLELDRARVLTHLAHRGYFDADLDWRIVERRPESEARSAVVDVVGEITLGPSTRIVRVRVEGLDDVTKGVRRRTRRSVGGRGDPFLLETHESNLAGLERTLKTLGYPAPKVEGEVRVRQADRSARLSYVVDPGVRARLGSVEVEGLSDVPRAPVLRRLQLERGDRFDISALERARVRLYGMDVFSIVSITPRVDLDDPSRVDVLVTVEERSPRGIALRAGIQLQSGRQEALAGVELSHVNALRRLWRVELDAEAGAAVVGSEIGQIASLGELRTGPVADVTLDLTVPDAPRPNWNTALQVGFEHTITEAFQTNRPSVSAIVSVAPRRTLALSGGYRFEFVDYVDLQIDPEELQSFAVAPDVVDGQYRNAELQARLVWDTRNDPLAPTRGQVVDLTGELAGVWLGGSYNYGGGTVDLRAYRGLGRRFDRLRRGLGLRRDALVFAGRLGGGILATYGPTASAAVPVAERLYLGGTGSVRGWAYQHLGPFVCEATGEDCAYAIDEPIAEGLDTVPIGGRVAAWGSAEVRRSFEYIRVVGFVDAGMAWAQLSDIARRRPLFSVGGGLRVLTPVGPIRADVAWRIDDPPEFSAQEPRFWIHLGIGEAF